MSSASWLNKPDIEVGELLYQPDPYGDAPQVWQVLFLRYEERAHEPMSRTGYDPQSQDPFVPYIDLSGQVPFANWILGLRQVLSNGLVARQVDIFGGADIGARLYKTPEEALAKTEWYASFFECDGGDVE